MKLATLACLFIVGSTIVSNVESTHILSGLFGGHHFHGHGGLLKEVSNLLSDIFGGKGGLNNFLDDIIRGVPDLLQKLLGGKEMGHFFGPLSKIPDNEDLTSILGGKCKGKEDTFGLLVKFAKTYCAQQKCDDGDKKEGDYKKDLEKIIDSDFEGNLDDFHKGLEELISSHEPSKKKQIYKCLSKLPEDTETSSKPGKHSSQSEEGYFSREEILKILIKFAKQKCNSGCDES